MKRIQVRLSVDSVQRAVREIAGYKTEIQHRADQLVEMLADEGVEIALIESEKLYQTGQLRQGIHSEYGCNAAFVKCSCTYAVYVEFGTGVKGEGASHPESAVFGWSYDVNSHGEAGWWYPTSPNDPNPTLRQTKNGIYIAWTKGMPSRPFMYNTAQQLRQLVIPAARSIFND